MSIMKDIWIEEVERSEHIYEIGQKALEEYPKGSIQVKRIKGREYNYLFWRDGGKIRSKYLGNDPQIIKKVQQLVEARKEREKAQSRLRQDIQLLKRALRIKLKGEK